MAAGNVNPYAAPNANLEGGLAADAPLAGAGARLAAVLLDSLVAMVVPLIAILATKGEDGEPSGIGMAVAGLWLLGLVIYQLILLSTRGQTLGKKWLGIKIVKLDGGPVTFGIAVIMRAFVGQGLLGIIPFYGLIDPLFIFRADRRCIHDMVAGTKVVQA
jgi:uncharacterized RDD family membrane protein YckC